MLFCLLCVSLSSRAQTFRRISSTDDVEVGVNYVIGGYCENCEDSVYVMATQTTSGMSITKRSAVLVVLGDYNRIEATDETAVFELEQSGSSYYFRDTNLDAYLSYCTSKVENYTSIYTLSDDEREEANTSSKKWYKSFSFNDDYPSSSRAFIQTKEEITIPNNNTKIFGMEVYSRSPDFRLYRTEVYGDSLYLFKEVEEPQLINEDADWTFYGDWLADSLYSFSFADAKRIDFSSISLPSKPSSIDISMPAEYVWTYVREGDAELLPDGWPNVIEVSDKDADVQGEAVTQIIGNDSCVFGAKYSFTVPADKEICWYRTISGDGGWMSGALPFDVQLVTWGSSSAQQVETECLAYARTTSQGAMFLQAEPDAAMTALQPFLWRPADATQTVVCFSAADVTVLAGDDSPATADGFYAACSRLDISQTDDALYLLSDDGLSFVRPAAGSWLAPCRAYLIYNATNAVNLRIIPETTSIQAVNSSYSDAAMSPVYRPDGTCAGFLPLNSAIPSDWPGGIYITKNGKTLKK